MGYNFGEVSKWKSEHIKYLWNIIYDTVKQKYISKRKGVNFVRGFQIETELKI